MQQIKIFNSFVGHWRTPYELKCESCGELFLSHVPNKKRCGPACKGKKVDLKVTRTCEKCGQQIRRRFLITNKVDNMEFVFPHCICEEGDS